MGTVKSRLRYGIERLREIMLKEKAVPPAERARAAEQEASQ